MSKKSKRGPAPTKRNKVIAKLQALGEATSADLGVETAYMATLINQNIVHVVAQADPRGEGKGRKRNVFRLTRSGNGKATAVRRHAVA